MGGTGSLGKWENWRRSYSFFVLLFLWTKIIIYIYE